jgi:hypothetical protein
MHLVQSFNSPECEDVDMTYLSTQLLTDLRSLYGSTTKRREATLPTCAQGVRDYVDVDCHGAQRGVTEPTSEQVHRDFQLDGADAEAVPGPLHRGCDAKTLDLPPNSCIAGLWHEGYSTHR